jgi:hypothetical protein
MRTIAVVVVVIVALMAGLILGLNLGSRGKVTQFLNGIGVHVAASTGTGGNAGASTSNLTELNLTGVTSSLTRILNGIGLHARGTANADGRAGANADVGVNGASSDLSLRALLNP